MDSQTQRLDRLRVVRRESPAAGPDPAKAVGLENPITHLYQEVMNDKASWTDAVFWMMIGSVLTLAGQWVVR